MNIVILAISGLASVIGAVTAIVAVRKSAHERAQHTQSQGHVRV
jgi:hypothetical protein